ncbi:hypothetical protein, partial [Mesotoga sp. HF07.pep.5.2.highcov]|uniref:hypothetical protein n=1 Tax=Mesotoga sp. HF07.pep.5.2.highcov TaxID=1462923 RepID=UPI001C7DF297
MERQGLFNNPFCSHIMQSCICEKWSLTLFNPNETLKRCKFRTLGVYISKEKMQQQYSYPVHPYLSSIQLICERLIWNDEKDFRWC